jgi:cysteine-rich repeat protein
VDTDTCLHTCELNTCGDGLRNPATEACDNGPNNADTHACRSTCVLNICGDGYVFAGFEGCDDGNLVDGDGCDHLCRPESTTTSSSGGATSGATSTQASSAAPVSSTSRPASSGIVAGSSGYRCPAPTPVQCEDADYAGSTCGQLALANGWCTTRCPFNINATQCNDPVFGGTVCGHEAVNSGACTNACAFAQTAITAALCESSWMDSVCGQLEAGMWAHAVNENKLGLSRCALVKDVQLPDGGVLMLAPPPSNPQAVLMPLTTLDGKGVTTVYPPRTHEPADVFPYVVSGLNHVGGTSTYRGWRTHQNMRQSSRNSAFNAADTMMDTIFRMRMDQNGKRVASCKEYVYEKYWNFSKWEDETAGAGNHWRTYYEKAFDSSRNVRGAQYQPVYAIGSRGLAHAPLKSRDGRELVKQVEFESENHAKNIFFTIGPKRAEWIHPTPISDVLQNILGIDVNLDPPACGGSIVPDNLMLCSEPVASALFEGITQHAVTDRGWTYHHTMATTLANAGYSDEDLYFADKLKDQYAVLLRKRSQIMEKILAILKSPLHTQFLPEGTVLPDTLYSPDPAWDNISIMRDRLSIGGLQTAQVTPITSQQAPAAAKGAFANGLSEGPLSQGLTLSAVQVSVAADLNAAQGKGNAQLYSHHVDNSTNAGFISAAGEMLEPALSLPEFQNRLKGLVRQLANHDAVMEQALLVAMDYGCLNLQGPNPCDWSPRDFAQAVVGFYAADQEADYQRCVRNTATGTFATAVHGRRVRLKNPAAPTGYDYPEIKELVEGPVNTIVSYPCALNAQGNLVADIKYESGDAVTRFDTTCPTCNDWNRDTTHMDTFFECVDGLKKMVIATVEKLGDLMDEKGRVRLSQSTGEHEQAGNDDFNMHYSYAFGWALGGFDSYMATSTPNACMLKPEMYGHVSAGATAFHKSVELVEGSAHVRTGDVIWATLPNTVTADTLELKILGVDMFQPLNTHVAASADIVHGDSGKSQDFLRVTVPFALGPIPMSLSGGVTGRLGVSYGARVDLGAAPGCANTKLTGYFTPYAGVEGFAEVGLDILVAAAGVKIALTIVEADLPFTVGVGLAVVDDQPGITLETNMDLVLKTLGGRFSVYLRILFASWDWTIFSWEGFQKTMNIFHAEMSLQLDPLRMALQDALAKVN